MAIVLWALAGSATENVSKVNTLQEGRASEEESRGKKAASNEGSEKDASDLEEKVCSTLL